MCSEQKMKQCFGNQPIKHSFSRGSGVVEAPRDRPPALLAPLSGRQVKFHRRKNFRRNLCKLLKNRHITPLLIQKSFPGAASTFRPILFLLDNVNHHRINDFRCQRHLYNRRLRTARQSSPKRGVMQAVAESAYEDYPAVDTKRTSTGHFGPLVNDTAHNLVE